MFYLIRVCSSTQRSDKKRAWEKLMTARAKTTERVQKHVSWRRSERKTVNSFFLHSSLCSSSKGVPCDLPGCSLWLTEGSAPPTPHTHTHTHSNSSMPPAARLTITLLPEGKDGGGGGLHQGETLPVGSRQFQAIAPCSLGFCLHTHRHDSM